MGVIRLIPISSFARLRISMSIAQITRQVHGNLGASLIPGTASAHSPPAAQQPPWAAFRNCVRRR